MNLPILLFLVFCIALGVAPAMLLLRERWTGTVLGAAILLGLAIPPAILFLLSILRVRWNLWFMIAGSIVLTLVPLVSILRRGDALQTRQAAESPRNRVPAVVIDAVTLLLLAGYAAFATVGPPAEGDFVTDWGLKGRIFWEFGGIDWGFLTSPWNPAAHPDYPPLLPLTFDAVALAAGGWTDEPLGLLYVLWGSAALFLIRSLLAEEIGAVLAAFGALVLLPFVLSPYLGMAEGPLAAYGTAAVLLIRRGVRGDPASLRTGAVFLGIATLIKNEGLTFLIAVLAASLLAYGWRVLRPMWVSMVIAIPWLVLRAVYGLPTDLTEGAVLERTLGNLKNIAPFLRSVAAHTPGKPLFFIGLALAFALSVGWWARRERLLLLTVVFQFLFLCSAYFMTPHDVEWHVRWSWERVLGPLVLLFAFVAVRGASAIISARRELPGANAAEPHPAAS